MILLLLVVLMLSCAGLHAQSPVFKATRLTVEDGLSDNMVYCALQDRQGFLWFGTRNGLNRYNGYHVTTFFHDRKDPHSLADAPVHSLYEDSKGRLWIGTAEGGLDLFDPVTERFIHHRHDPNNPQSIDPGVISGICEDPSGHLWIVRSHIKRGIQRFDPERGVFVTYRHSEKDPYSLSGDAIMGLCRDTAGNIWISTWSSGLNRYDPVRDRFINYRTEPGYRFAPSKGLGLIFAASDGGFWVCDTTTNAWKVYARNGRLEIMPKLVLNQRPNLHSDGITSVIEGVDGMQWFSTLASGIHTINKEHEMSRTAATETDPYGLGSNRVYQLYEDHFGDIWACTDVGVQRFHRRTNYMQHFSHNPLDTSSISYPKIRSLMHDSEGRFLVGTGGGGLDVIHNGRIRHVTNSLFPGDIGSNTFNALYQTRDGVVWAGTNNHLYTVDPATGVFTRPDYKLHSPRVWSFHEDREGILWIGTLYGGVTGIDRRTGRKQDYLIDVETQRSKTMISVHTMCEDRKQNLWLGTNNGLYRLDRRKGEVIWSAFNSTDTTSLSYNHVWYIHEARDGRLWIATSGGGLNLFDPASGRCVRYGKEQGLPSEIVCGILEDDHGNLWLSSNSGLFRFTPSTGKILTFGVNDGVYINEFHFKTCWRDRLGVLYFGGAGGFLRFHPDSITAGARPKKLIFTSFKVFDQKLALDSALTVKKQIVLSHKSNYFSVEFASLDFAGRHHHSYRYKLDGYDRQWQQTDGTRPFAGYTDVPPGDYTLLVEVTDAEGNWSGTSGMLHIAITPAWWQTLWFQGALALVLVLSGVGSLRWYMRSVRRKSAIERRLVEFQLQVLRSQINPHFVFNSLNSIYYFIISQENDKAQEYLCTFSVLLRSILEYSHRKFLSIEQEVSVLSMYLEMESVRFAGQFHYEIRLDPAIDARTSFIPSMLLQPYVENAIRHGLLPKNSDRLLLVEFKRQGESILCSITDNGIGRAQAEEVKRRSVHSHTSQGMSLSEQRLEGLNVLYGDLYGIEIEDLAEDGAAAGTRITIRIPFGMHEAEVQ